MKPMNLEHVVRKIDRRLERVEQILPTLPTREELATLGERLDARITEEAERSRRHTQVLLESVTDKISIVAAGLPRPRWSSDRPSTQSWQTTNGVSWPSKASTARLEASPWADRCHP
jgi:hypothetical protein